MKDYKKLRCRDDCELTGPPSRWLPSPRADPIGFCLQQPATRSSTLTSSSTNFCTKTACLTSSSRDLPNATSSRRPRASPSGSPSSKKHLRDRPCRLPPPPADTGRDAQMGVMLRWRTARLGSVGGAGVGVGARAGVKVGDTCRGVRVGAGAGVGVGVGQGVWRAGRVGRGVSVRIGSRGCSRMQWGSEGESRRREGTPCRSTTRRGLTGMCSDLT